MVSPCQVIMQAGGLSSITWITFLSSFTAVSDKYSKVADGLVVINVTKEDMGEYTCKGYQVSPTVVNSREKTIRLNVLRKFGFDCMTEICDCHDKVQAETF